MVLKGKANSPAKTFLGEMPALLTLDSSKEKERIPLLSKGSYRAVFCASGERMAGLESGVTTQRRQPGCASMGAM